MNGLARAGQALRTAEGLVGSDLAAAANRLYTAGENLAIAAIVLSGGQAPRNHGKIWNATRLLFQRGVLERDYWGALETAYRLRLYGDYGEAAGETIFTEETVRGLLATLRLFLKEVEKLAAQKQY